MEYACDCKQVHNGDADICWKSEEAYPLKTKVFLSHHDATRLETTQRLDLRARA